MRSRISLLVVGVMFVGQVAVSAAEAPVAVSPGNTSKFTLVEGRCPTFSWGAVPRAKSYELVVYLLGEDSEEAQPVLGQTFAGSASSWTPSLDRCLDRGGQYAWSVRAARGKAASEWSQPSLFQVASGPSAAEFEEALALVRQYLVTRGGAEPEGVAEAQAGTEATAKTVAPVSSPGTRGGPGPTQLTVDGGVVATGFTGDGSFLNSLPASEIFGTLSTDRYDAYNDLSVSGRLDNNASDDIQTRIQADSSFLNVGEAHNHSATEITAGTLSTSRYDAYNDLSDSARLDDADSTDIQTRGQADNRFLRSGNNPRFYGCGSYTLANFCPAPNNFNGPNCNDVPAGSYCESDGECGLSTAGNCGTAAWYFKWAE